VYVHHSQVVKTPAEAVVVKVVVAVGVVRLVAVVRAL